MLKIKTLLKRANTVMKRILMFGLQRPSSHKIHEINFEKALHSFQVTFSCFSNSSTWAIRWKAQHDKKPHEPQRSLVGRGEHKMPRPRANWASGRHAAGFAKNLSAVGVLNYGRQRANLNRRKRKLRQVSVKLFTGLHTRLIRNLNMQ